MRHRIRDHDPRQLTIVQRLNRIAAQDTMRHYRHYFFGAMLHYRVGGFHERAACVRHVVDEDGDFVLDVPDQDHAGYFVRAGALLVDEGEAEVETVGYGCRSIPQTLAFHPSPILGL